MAREGSPPHSGSLFRLRTSYYHRYILRPLHPFLTRRGILTLALLVVVFVTLYYAQYRIPGRLNLTESVAVDDYIRPTEASHPADDFYVERENQTTHARPAALDLRINLSSDPSGPNIVVGSVGSAEKRFKSWEGGRKDGRMLIEEGKRHPIFALMERAKKRWTILNERQSKTFADAVREYKRRYGRSPPHGFDKWYAFARYHNVQLIDEFDLIESDFRIYRAFSGPSFRARVEKLKEIDFTWGIRVQDGVVSREGQIAHHTRAQGVENLTKKYAHELPDMLMWYNGHDSPKINIGWDERMRLDQLVASGTYDDFDPENPDIEPVLPSGWDMPPTCPPDSAVREESFEYGHASRDATGLEIPEVPEGAIGTVIDSFKTYMDVCNSPQYRHFHTSSSWTFPLGQTSVKPFFTPGVHVHFADIHAVITEQFDQQNPYDPPWEERPFDRLVWRGQTSGPYFSRSTAWRTTQRARLHLLTHNEEGNRTIVVTDDDGLARKIEVRNYRVNPIYFDVGLVGPAVQCDREDGTCEEMKRVFKGYETRMSFEKATLYKYAGDFDGNTWSGRFRRLMASNACVIKSTIFPEFWQDWVVPWLHFIPVQVDYSDLWDVLAFFRGGPNGEGAHDDLANEIAQAGKAWAAKYYRWEDLEVYTFRQYLEYGRLWADDREEMSYNGPTDYEPVWIPKEE